METDEGHATMSSWEKASHWFRIYFSLTTLICFLLISRKIWLKSCGQLCILVFFITDSGGNSWCPYICKLVVTFSINYLWIICIEIYEERSCKFSGQHKSTVEAGILAALGKKETKLLAFHTDIHFHTFHTNIHCHTFHTNIHYYQTTGTARD